MIKLQLNGKKIELDVPPDMPLLWAIREKAGLTGTKFGCGIAACGACTVHVNGQAIRSCVYPVQAAEGASITTIEGLSSGKDLHALQKAWIAHQVPQCGYCQSGMLMAAAVLLKEKPNPTDEDIKQSITNICRCGTYDRIHAAIKSVAQGKGASNE
jgi:isoquinoline 1-oxidoreductase alpha subunit